MEQWVSARQIAQMSEEGIIRDYPKTRDGVRRRVIKENISTKRSGTTLYVSLPEILQAQNNLILPKKKNTKKLREYKLETRKGLKNDLLDNYLEKVKCAPAKKKTETARKFVFEYNNGLILKEIFDVLGPTSFKSLERWKLRKERQGIRALEDTRGGSSPSYELTPEQEAILVAAIRHPHRLLKNEMVRLFRKNIDNKGLPPCPMSDYWILRWIEAWIDDHYDLYVQATKGHRATLNTCVPYIRRDWELLEVGECLVADGHVWNGEIKHPRTGKPCRPIVLEFYDLRSNMIVGTEVMTTENIRCIASALRRSIIRLGKYPKYIYLDNGKAFRAKFFHGCPDFRQAGIKGVYEKFCDSVIFAKVRNARAKPIERHFLSKGELERLSPSYVGTNIENKPARMIQGEILHQRFWKKWTDGILPTVEELYAAIVSWNEKEYAYRRQEKSHLKGDKPIDVFNSGIGLGVDIEKLNELMLFETQKKITQNGVKLSIYGEDEFFYNEIFYGKRRMVNVRYDRYAISNKEINWVEVLIDDSWVKAYRRLKTHPLAFHEGTAEQKKELTTQIKQQNHLLKQTEKDFRKVVEDDARAYSDLPAPVKKAKPEPKPEVVKIDTDAILSEVREREEKVIVAAPSRPLFNSIIDRYEWLINQDHYQINDNDLKFMKEYEETHAIYRN